MNFYETHYSKQWHKKDFVALPMTTETMINVDYSGLPSNYPIEQFTFMQKQIKVIAKFEIYNNWSEYYNNEVRATFDHKDGKIKLWIPVYFKDRVILINEKDLEDSIEHELIHLMQLTLTKYKRKIQNNPKDKFNIPKLTKEEKTQKKNLSKLDKESLKNILNKLKEKYLLMTKKNLLQEGNPAEMPKDKYLLDLEHLLTMLHNVKTNEELDWIKAILYYTDPNEFFTWLNGAKFRFLAKNQPNVKNFKNFICLGPYQGDEIFSMLKDFSPDTYKRAVKEFWKIMSPLFVEPSSKQKTKDQ